MGRSCDSGRLAASPTLRAEVEASACSSTKPPGARRRGSFGKSSCEPGRYQVMFFFHVLLLLQLLLTSFAFPHNSRQLQESKNAMKKVFTSAEEANLFIGRRLLYNRFDFEMIIPGNLERECLEEQCTIEEAREVLGDPEKTMAFWNNYSKTARGTKMGEQAIQKIDVIGLLTGLVATGILLVIAGILIYYLCQKKCKPRRLSGHGSSRRRNSSILRRQEEFSLHPLSLHAEQTGLPTYEQAVALRDSYSPPPPYPGPAGVLKAFKKSLSLPGP